MDTVLAEKLSALVKYQLPDFVRDNYETFQAFLIAYYEFLEQNTEVQYYIQNAKNFNDIDNTLDTFVDLFLKEYAYDLPESIFINQETKEALSADTYESKRSIAKHLRQYYASKGSESGVKLLFRLLFDDDISFYYPKEDIFKPSSGIWTKRKTVKLINTTSNTIPSGAIITGNSSGAYAIVDTAYLSEKRYSNLLAEITEIQFESNSLENEFIKGEGVTISYGNITSGNLEIYGSGRITNVISEVGISDAGIGHSLGDTVTVSYDKELAALTTLQSPVSSNNYLFGKSVAASNSYVAIGSPGTNLFPFFTQDGYVHVYSSTNYGLLYSKTSPETPSGGNFGQQVAISEQYLVVSEPYITTSSYGGNVHIYHASNGTKVATVTGPSAALMGESLALSGNYIVAGAPSMDYYSHGGNVFLIAANTGTIVKTIENPNYAGSPILDLFGRSVAISPSYIVVGSGGVYEEAVYLFGVPSGNYIRKISNPNIYGVNDDGFGRAVAITDSYVAVSAPYESSASGTAGSPGIVYVFDISGTLLTKIENPDYDVNGITSNLFGDSLAIVDNTLVIGQSQKYSANNEIQSGKIYMYELPSGRLLDQYDNINDYGTPASDAFGESIAISPQKLVVAGAPYEDSALYTQLGRAYLFGPDYQTQSSFRGVVSKVSGLGRVKEIEIENFGNDFTEYPIQYVTGRITSPTLTYTGKYAVTSNIATVVLFDDTGNSINHGLNAGDSLSVKFPTGLVGANGIATVTSILSSRKFTIAKGNTYYTSSGNIEVLPITANISATIGALCEYPGTYDTNRDGHISDIKKLQDSDYYQEHSYVIRATKSSYLWKDIIKKTLHPAGLKLFSDVYISTANSIVSINVEPENGIYQTIVYLLKLLSSSVVNTLDTVGPTTIFNIETVSKTSRGLGRYRVGSTLKTIDKFKFDYTSMKISDIGDILVGYDPYEPTLFTPPDGIRLVGNNIVLNSYMGSSSDWFLDTGWSISSGNLRYTGNAGFTASPYLKTKLQANVTYRVEFDVDSLSGEYGWGYISANVSYTGFSGLIANTTIKSNLNFADNYFLYNTPGKKFFEYTVLETPTNLSNNTYIQFAVFNNPTGTTYIDNVTVIPVTIVGN